MAFTIDTDFPGGSIEVVRIPKRGAVELALREDSAADIRQWFDFRVSSDSIVERELVLTNAGEATFPNGWPDYRAMVSFDGGKRWSRADTELDGDVVRIRHAPRSPITEYAYFAPYSLARLERALKKVHACPWADVSELGSSAQGRPLYCATFGSDDAPQTIWIIARQHPGETPAGWAAAGLLARLCDPESEIVQALLEQACVRVVPLANPDGAELGNMRTSATGVNLNRVWDAPGEDAPEVVAILEAIKEGRVDLFFDLHADESGNFAFASCSEGNPSYDDDIAAAEAALRDDLAELAAEFIDEPFYDLDPPGEADLSIAANQIGETFGCPALTLELPIKDRGGERIRDGWSPARAQKLGAALVEVALRAALRLQDDE